MLILRDAFGGGLAPVRFRGWPVGLVRVEPPEVEEEGLVPLVELLDQADALLAEDLGEVHRVIGIIFAQRQLVADEAGTAFVEQGSLAPHLAAQRLLLALREEVIEAVLLRTGNLLAAGGVAGAEPAEVSRSDVGGEIANALQQLRQGVTFGEELPAVVKMAGDVETQRVLPGQYRCASR